MPLTCILYFSHIISQCRISNKLQKTNNVFTNMTGKQWEAKRANLWFPSTIFPFLHYWKQIINKKKKQWDIIIKHIASTHKSKGSKCPLQFKNEQTQQTRTPKSQKKKLDKNDTSRSSEPHGGLVRRVCRSYSRKKSLIRSLIGYNEEHNRKRNLNTLFPSSK